ncbi:ribosomal protein 63, mitochondrial-like isoform X1 [Haliotis rubra]|uniref:ribosomal protein 63, mitochondrial-like isoform X1 n=1 Tax=Haliotis rubra TaxID=36100 RepID=UPI001EE5FE27|nr:ribosomal protein 63, mitochondrial-like isoform X1 [Haliotis rubra]
MFFTRCLQYYKHRIRVPGLLYQGKNKVIPRISVDAKRRALCRLLVEQDNLDILKNPYLTMDEEHGHTKERSAVKLERIRAAKKMKMIPHRHLEVELNHLNCSKKWE